MSSYFFIEDVYPAPKAAWMVRAVATRGKKVKGSFPGSSWMKLVGRTRGTKVSHGKDGEEIKADRQRSALAKIKEQENLRVVGW